MTTHGISESLRAAIIAAIEAYEQDEMPQRERASAPSDAWRNRGRRMTMGLRFIPGRTVPAMPFRSRPAHETPGRIS